METCLVCDGQTKLVESPGGYQIVKCTKCGLGHTQTKDMQKRQYHRDKVYLENQDLLENSFRKTFKIVSKLKKGGRVLDIGSSTGLMLKIFKDVGWEVQGIEPSPKASVYSIKQGIPTLKTTFEKAKLKNGYYDVVIFNHVLEHLDNPIKTLEKAQTALKKGGLMVISVPNFGSLSARIYGAEWQYVLPQEHKWHFTCRALSVLLKAHGFRVLQWSARSGIWEYGDPTKEVLQALITGKKRFFSDILTAIPTWFVSQSKLGTGLSVIAQKI